jgi:hypothetical protein
VAGSCDRWRIHSGSSGGSRGPRADRAGARSGGRRGRRGLWPFHDVLEVAFGARTNALLCLGPLESGEPLSSTDLRELLASLHVAAMIENARLFALATQDRSPGSIAAACSKGISRRSRRASVAALNPSR